MNIPFAVIEDETTAKAALLFTSLAVIVRKGKCERAVGKVTSNLTFVGGIDFVVSPEPLESIYKCCRSYLLGISQLLFQV